MKIYCLILWILLNCFERFESINYCKNKKHFLCGNDCLRPPKCCDGKTAQLDIGKKHISDMVHSINNLRNELAAGKLKMEILVSLFIGKGLVYKSHTLSRGYGLNEVVSACIK